ncbi:MAG: hypothetical protein WED32_00905, partial [Patescibacteria group bacterium]
MPEKKLIVVSFFEDLEPGYRFPAGDWPVHLTLLLPFGIEETSVSDLEARLADVFARQDPVEVVCEEAV